MQERCCAAHGAMHAPFAHRHATMHHAHAQCMAPSTKPSASSAYRHTRKPGRTALAASFMTRETLRTPLLSAIGAGAWAQIRSLRYVYVAMLQALARVRQALLLLGRCRFAMHGVLSDVSGADGK